MSVSKQTHFSLEKYKRKKIKSVLCHSFYSSRYWKTTFNNNNTIISQNINNDNNNSIAREKAVKIEADLACPPAAPALLLRWKPILK